MTCRVSTLQTRCRGVEYRARLEAAVGQAREALACSLQERRRRYTFVARYPGPWPTYSDSDAEIGHLPDGQSVTPSLSLSQSVSQSVNQSLTQSGGQTGSQAVTQSVRRSGSQSVSQSASHSVSQSFSQAVSHSLSQAVRQAARQSLSQSGGQAVSQSVSQPVIQSVSHSVSQAVRQSISHPVSHSVSQSVSQSVTYRGTRLRDVVVVGGGGSAVYGAGRGRPGGGETLRHRINTTDFTESHHPAAVTWQSGVKKRRNLQN